MYKVFRFLHFFIENLVEITSYHIVIGMGTLGYGSEVLEFSVVNCSTCFNFEASLIMSFIFFFYALQI